MEMVPHSEDKVLIVKKSDDPEKQTLVWRMIVCPHIEKVWPVEEDHVECSHEDIYWGLDHKVRPITLCDECGSFNWGHKTGDDNVN